MKTKGPTYVLTLALFAPGLHAADTLAESDMAPLMCERIQNARFTFGGPLGERIRANVANWLLPAPDANPGLLEMFRLRDREPPPALVPWAGEFVGKYLISAIQARRMSSDPALEDCLRRVVRELISLQAEDGYLGPFPKRERLLGHWDLWGHYHCMLALMMWHEDAGDEDARQCAMRAADLICRTYLGTDRRPIDAGSPEMNLAVIHVLGWIYRDTRDERYLRMVRVLEQDFEKAGDYVRQGLAGIPFYQTPSPRWESLHDIQGILELYLITGDERYRTSFQNLWQSMARFDRHNTGGFTTNERAIGNPYTPGAIETCCTTAWMALTIDMLRLTADSKIADELEWSMWNSVLASQHPSGRWWTYNTPMDGRREASAHTIVFQARAGTPELNCCSVNAPRGLGMLSEWAVMQDDHGIMVNAYGPMIVNLSLSSGVPLRLSQDTAYPADGHVALEVSPAKSVRFALHLRIPRWAAGTIVRLNGEDVDGVQAGQYLVLRREWQPGDRIEIVFDMSIRVMVGDGRCSGQISLFSGPLLLAYDQRLNSFDAENVPTLDVNSLEHGQRPTGTGLFAPMVLFCFTGADGRSLDLCDFASAGTRGTHYRSWLPATNAPPPPFHLLRPRLGEAIVPGPIRFRWTGARGVSGRAYTLSIASIDEAGGRHTVFTSPPLERPWFVLHDALSPGATYHWSVAAGNATATVHGMPASQAFTIDPDVTPDGEGEGALVRFRDDGLVTAAPLAGDGQPSYGSLVEARNVKPAPGRQGGANQAVELAGDGLLRYQIPYFPEDDYSVAVWVCMLAPPVERYSQVFSAWCQPMDDPLRITIEDGRVHARIEAGGSWGTKGAPLVLGRWTHVAAVKAGERLTLYVEGAVVESVGVPESVFSEALDVALGGNPHYSGNESLVGRLADAIFYARALRSDEVEALAVGRPLGNTRAGNDVQR